MNNISRSSWYSALEYQQLDQLLYKSFKKYDYLANLSSIAHMEICDEGRQATTSTDLLAVDKVGVNVDRCIPQQ